MINYTYNGKTWATTGEYKLDDSYGFRILYLKFKCGDSTVDRSAERLVAIFKTGKIHMEATIESQKESNFIKEMMWRIWR